MTKLLVLVLLAKDPATIADLKILAEHKSYPELLERAEEVAPGARDETWRNLVTAAAAGVIPTTVVEKNVFVQVARADALRQRFAFLEKQPAFLVARDEAVIAGLRRCQRTSDDACFRQFSRYELTLTPAGSLAAGKALRRGGAVAHRAMPLFARAVGAKDAPACKDDDVAEATLAGLDTPDENDSAKAARQVAFEWCWSALQAKVKASMAGATSMRLQNVCKPMRAKNALTPTQNERCQDADL